MLNVFRSLFFYGLSTALFCLLFNTEAFAHVAGSCASQFEEKSQLWPLGSDQLEQEFSSSATSINSDSLPAAMYALVENQVLKPKSTNLDIGGGRFDNATRALKSASIKNLIYDPFNRSPSHNQSVISQVLRDGVDTVTVNNVLNVIKDRENWELILRQATQALKPEGWLFIQIHEGRERWNKEQRENFYRLAQSDQWAKALKLSEAGQTGKDSWQNKMPIEAYLAFVQKYFPEAQVRNFSYTTGRGKSGSVKIIVAQKLASIEDLLRQAKKIGIDSRAKKYGVGKKMGPEVYLHRDYESVLPQKILRKAKAQLPRNFDYTVIRYNEKTDEIAFLESPDFDVAPEPTVGRSIRVKTDGTQTMTKPSADPLIYHHKWMFVADDYQGFSVTQSLQRSLWWKSQLGNNKKVSSLIGRKSYWENEFLPKLK